ncbi:MAG: DUF2119 domain-containing protein [Methanobacterium sp.]|nr:DUF2119 domain-containing protein [Methanobacterium sp.]
MLLKAIDKGTGPTRVFIGGVHGKEGLTTLNPIKLLNEDDVKDGKLFLYNYGESKYISTLDPFYYQSTMGEKILNIVKTHKPDIYVELHCYKLESYHKLVDMERKEKVGVPPLIELEYNVLLSSVAPYLRTKVFRKNDICITLELPCKPEKKSVGVYVEVMKIIAGSNNRAEIEDKLRVKYPSQVIKAQKYAAEFFGGYPAF